MRLIDADALTEKCGDWYVEEGPEDGFIGTLGQLLSVQPKTNCSEISNNSDAISRQRSIDALRKMQTYKLFAGDDMLLIDQAEAQTELMMLPSVQPERKTVFNRDIAIEAICDEVMLWFDVSATKAYEIAETAVKRIEVRMEKTEKGEQE